MKLHSFNFVPFVSQSHNDPVIRLRCYRRLSRQTLSFHNQGAITRRGKRVSQLPQHALPIMVNLAGLAMNQWRSALYLPAKSRSNRLVPQAHAKNWKLPRQFLDQLHGNSRLLRRAWTWRNHNPFRLFPLDIFNADLIVAMHFHLASQFAQILRQVVSKRVVVVEQQNHFSFLLPLFRPALPPAFFAPPALVTI